MKTMTTLLFISLAFINFAYAADPECHAGLVGLGDTYPLTKVQKDSVTTFSGGDNDVHFFVLANLDALTLETDSLKSQQKTAQQGPALLPGQTIIQVLQVSVDGRMTAYFLRCKAP